MHGLVVRRVHVDCGRSGYKDVLRKGFDAATEAVTSGAVRTLIVWKLDRLSRKGTAEVGPPQPWQPVGRAATSGRGGPSCMRPWSESGLPGLLAEGVGSIP
ncbi:recombinase family protein [Streptomyces sp. NPDC047061]|uniref:recombinase family protein n=1 Tax=Streptomyces sp. NPDC047061 TaxID=3154605 RepID=UPI0033F16127